MAYVPDQGDVVWLNFSPQSGHEQAGKCPAFVVSPRAYNKKASLALFCPITVHVKGYPFEVVLPEDQKVQGAILSDQVKSLNWTVRKAKFITKLPFVLTEDVLAKILTLMSQGGL